jgi:glycosyltransferase involved in cell wall biosynthesis
MGSISVVLSTYSNDDPDELAVALTSVFGQTRPPTEVVVVKDGPVGDEIQTVLDTFERAYPEVFVQHQLSTNVGKGGARRAGVAEANGEYVAVMDSDDICHRRRLEREADFLDANHAVDLVGSHCTEFDDSTGELHAVRTVPTDHEEIESTARYRNPINQVTAMFRRAAVMEVGNYEEIRRLEDYRLWVRLLNDGKVLHNIPESLVLVRAGRGMHERRGGLAYARSEVRMEYDFYRWGFVPLWLAVANSIVRVSVRAMPNRLRGVIYTHLLRD